MSMGTMTIGRLTLSRVIIGGNPFSGFSHQGRPRDAEMRRWYTVARIKQALRQAEGLGVTAHLSRADHHVMRYLLEYWDEGGTIRWLAQTCPGVGPILHGVRNAVEGQASACHVHGGVMDYLLANNQLQEVPQAVAAIRQAGMPAGIAGHNPAVFQWAEANLDVDYYLCSYYNPGRRDKRAEHVSGATEVYRPEDRGAMVKVIAGLSRPVIHYKVLAAGRNDPKEALTFVARHLRPQDAVCVGVFTKEQPDALTEDIRLLEEALAAVA